MVVSVFVKWLTLQVEHPFHLSRDEMPLLDVPVDVLIEITRHISNDDYVNLLRSCRDVYRAIAGHIYRRIVLAELLNHVELDPECIVNSLCCIGKMVRENTRWFERVFVSGCDKLFIGVLISFTTAEQYAGIRCVNSKLRDNRKPYVPHKCFHELFEREVVTLDLNTLEERVRAAHEMRTSPLHCLHRRVDETRAQSNQDPAV